MLHLSLDMDFFDYHVKTQAKALDYVMHRVNLQEDTLWLNMLYPFLDDIQWCCGRCASGKDRARSADCAKKLCLTKQPNGPIGLYRLAINYEDWKKPGPAFDMMGTAELLVCYRNAELLLVVGDLQIHETDRNVYFDTPMTIPFLTANSIVKAELRIPQLEDRSWEEMESKVTKDMQTFKDTYIQMHQQAPHSQSTIRIICKANMCSWGIYRGRAR